MYNFSTCIVLLLLYITPHRGEDTLHKLKEDIIHQKKPIRLILTDLDNTVKPFKKAVPQINIDAFNLANKSGLTVGFSTGRNPSSMVKAIGQDTVEALNYTNFNPGIFSGGSYIIGYSPNEVLADVVFDINLQNQLLDFLNHKDIRTPSPFAKLYQPPLYRPYNYYSRGSIDYVTGVYRDIRVTQSYNDCLANPDCLGAETVPQYLDPHTVYTIEDLESLKPVDESFIYKGPIESEVATSVIVYFKPHLLSNNRLEYDHPSNDKDLNHHDDKENNNTNILHHELYYNKRTNAYSRVKGGLYSVAFNRFVLIAAPKKLPYIRKEIESYFPDQFLIAQPLDFILEIGVKGTSKATAIDIIAQKYNLSLDEIIAIGDSENDLEALTFAKYSVAVGNASKAAVEAAKYHMDKTCADGAFAQVIDVVLEANKAIILDN